MMISASLALSNYLSNSYESLYSTLSASIIISSSKSPYHFITQHHLFYSSSSLSFSSAQLDHQITTSLYVQNLFIPIIIDCFLSIIFDHVLSFLWFLSAQDIFHLRDCFFSCSIIRSCLYSIISIFITFGLQIESCSLCFYRWADQSCWTVTMKVFFCVHSCESRKRRPIINHFKVIQIER